MKTLLAFTTLALALNFSTARAENIAKKAADTLFKSPLDFHGVTPKTALDFIGKESGIKIDYTPLKDPKAEPRISLFNIPGPVTAAEAFKDVAMLGNLSIVYMGDSVQFEPNTAKTDEPTSGDWVRVVGTQPFSSRESGNGLAVFIRYSTANRSAIFAVPYSKDHQAAFALSPSDALLPGAGGCLRTFFAPPGKTVSLDEIRLQLMSPTGVVSSKFPAKFDGAAPFQPVKDLSTLLSPGALWVYLSKLDDRALPEGKELTDNLLNVKLATANYLQRFPNDPLKWDVKLADANVTSQLADAGQTDYTVDQAEKQYQEIAATPGIPDTIQTEANFNIALIQVRKAGDEPAAIAAAVTAYHHDHTADWNDNSVVALLREQLKAGDQTKREALLGAVAKSSDKDVAAQADEILRHISVGKRLADLKINPLDWKFTAVDGTPVDLSKLRGKVVLVDFWATWCGPCMAEMPNVTAAYSKYHDKGFEIVGVSLDEDKDAVIHVTKDKGMIWPQYFDGKGWKNVMAETYGINAIPAMWLVNKKGMAVNLSARDGLEASIEKLLAE